MNLRVSVVALAVVILAACTSTPTPSGTPTTAPTAPPTATATLAPTATPTTPPTAPPTTSPTFAPTPTSTVQPTPLADWTAPELIARGDFNETDVVVDSHGAVHVAATGVTASGEGNRGIWYITNASGRWTSRKVSGPPLQRAKNPGDGEPSIALDADGSVWIAFSRWSCVCFPDTPEGTWYVTNVGGTWSEARQVARDARQNPTLFVRDGIVYLAYEERTNYYGHGEDYPVWYSTNASGTWVTTQVARRGHAPRLSVDATGRVQILYVAPNDIRLVTQRPSGDFGAPEELPGSIGGSGLAMAIDAARGRLWAAWDQHTADSSNVMVARHGPDGWSQPELAVTNGHVRGLAANGFVNVTASAAGADAIDELLYAWNADADHSFSQQQLAPAGGSYSAIATGPLGRAYVVYVIEDPSLATPGVWFRMHLLPAGA